MSHWKEYKLGEIAELRKESFMPNCDMVFPYIGLEHIEPESLSLNGIGQSSDVTSQKFKFYPNDVLYGKLRPYFKKVYSPNFEGVCSTDIYVVKAKNGVNSKYLFYLFATDEFTQLANSGSTGTRMPRADWKHLSETLWNIPDLPTQTAIASILSSLDQKIELNNAINRNLEALAQALFKQWFVDFNFPVDEHGNFSPFPGEMSEGQRGYKDSGGEMIESELGMIPKGWRVGKLGDVSTLIAGGDKPKNNTPTPDNKCKFPIYSNGISNNGLQGYTDKPRIFEESVTVSARGTIGFVCLRMQPYFPIVRLIAVIPNGSIISSKYLYQWLKNQNISGTGTTQQQLTVPDFSGFKILIPQIEIVKKYTLVMDSFFQTITSNITENQSLSKIRDTLLPKLISGELEVKDINTVSV